MTDVTQRRFGRGAGSYVVGCAFAGDTACFALGDGTVRLSAGDDDFRSVTVHDGAVLSVALAPDGRGVVTGGDDGRVVRTGADGSTEEIVGKGSRWAEVVAAHPSGLIAVGTGKTLRVLGADGAVIKTLSHPSTVTGAAFDAKGKRVAVSHYNGASLWFINAKGDTPRALEWKGSHTGVLIDPPGEHVVTLMQDNALHGWKLADGGHMRMAGYPAKIMSAAFTRTGKFLLTSGADTVVMWPFAGSGPAGKQPLELGGGEGVQVTRVAAHSKSEMFAAGFADGSVLVGDIPTKRVLQVVVPTGSPVSALAWHASGNALLAGNEAGAALVVGLGV